MSPLNENYLKIKLIHTPTPVLEVRHGKDDSIFKSYYPLLSNKKMEGFKDLLNEIIKDSIHNYNYILQLNRGNNYINLEGLDEQVEES